MPVVVTHNEHCERFVQSMRLNVSYGRVGLFIAWGYTVQITHFNVSLGSVWLVLI